MTRDEIAAAMLARAAYWEELGNYERAKAVPSVESLRAWGQVVEAVERLR